MLAVGLVRVTRIETGWHVELGRGRGVKRFNLSDAEAAQLVEQLADRGVYPPSSERGELYNC